jgi:hypothetical protein
MIRFLIGTFLVFTLALNVSVEYFGGPENDEQHSSISSDKQDVESSVASYEDNHGCDNCESDGCHHEDGHCSHHCSGLHNILAGQSSSYNEPDRIKITSKINFDYANHYKNPYLDSKIIPPNFS